MVCPTACWKSFLAIKLFSIKELIYKKAYANTQRLMIRREAGPNSGLELRALNHPFNLPI